MNSVKKAFSSLLTPFLFSHLPTNKNENVPSFLYFKRGNSDDADGVDNDDDNDDAISIGIKKSVSIGSPTTRILLALTPLLIKIS